MRIQNIKIKLIKQIPPFCIPFLSRTKDCLLTINYSKEITVLSFPSINFLYMFT